MNFIFDNIVTDRTLSVVCVLAIVASVSFLALHERLLALAFTLFSAATGFLSYARYVADLGTSRADAMTRRSEEERGGEDEA